MYQNPTPKFGSEKKCPTCPKCMRTFSTSFVFALHHDKHNTKPSVKCVECLKSYASPAKYYKADFCKENDIPGTLNV